MALSYDGVLSRGEDDSGIPLTNSLSSPDIVDSDYATQWLHEDTRAIYEELEHAQ